MTRFTDFGLAEPILAALASSGYETPTPIQAQAIPHLMTGRDLLGIAQTGTGKTAAFALPIIHRLVSSRKRPAPHSARCLVLAPTRELASQIAESFSTYAGDTQLTVETVFGGVSIGRQERAIFRGVDVLVATPGRLLDLVDRGSCRLDLVETLVLDEADQMLDLGFIHALKRIAKLVPAKRQTLLFSATMPKTIAGLADGYLTDPIKVSVTPVAATADRIEQGVFLCESRTKQALLEHLLSRPDFDRVIVFTRTKHGADRVVKHLGRAGIEGAAIHGNKSQPQREKALAAFRDGEIGVLVATDIAARGIDIDGVSHVVNFELPNIPESYVHRIGRTARAGAEGTAVSFCNREEQAYLKDIERLIRRSVPRLQIPKSVHERAAELAKAARVDDDDTIAMSIARDRRRGGASVRGDEDRGGRSQPAQQPARKGAEARGGRKPAAGAGTSAKPAAAKGAPKGAKEARQHHHAGRPQDVRSGGNGRVEAERHHPRDQAARGNHQPRDEFRAREEVSITKGHRDTRHGERFAAPRDERGGREGLTRNRAGGERPRSAGPARPPKDRGGRGDRGPRRD